MKNELGELCILLDLAPSSFHFLKIRKICGACLKAKTKGKISGFEK